jgi:hypothetical protein
VSLFLSHIEFLLIKDVAQVNEVTVNPQISTDPSRSWRYLSPNIFKLLIPVGYPESYFRYNLPTVLTITCLVNRASSQDQVKGGAREREARTRRSIEGTTR